ncbi:MAG: lipid-A-disaccharide synthase [Candidatus Latescibacteria bacterium]|jgi:lipid-A-disaccharide synthase|nr:lipid-A-disaccharide synthase [Candidatus Latescibacterota bacterium]
MKRVFLIAGESSGDLHGSSLMRSMRSRIPEIEFRGIGGSRMVDEGLHTVRHVREMNFMGIAEVIRHIPFIRQTMKELEELIDSWHPDLVILIDYPGFNLKFAPLVKKRKIPLMYYISPQLWAWHKNRVHLVNKYVDRMVVIFKFEKDFYREYGIEADFVGHPLLDVVSPSVGRETFRASLGVTDYAKLIGLFPGSRMQEIDRILPQMVESISLLRKKSGSHVAVIGCAPEIDDSVYQTYLKNSDIIPLRGKGYDIMAHSDALIVTSGTATLEAGILGAPMVIVYRTSFLTYIIGKALLEIPDIGLINIVAGSRTVPELWQNDVTGENISSQIETLISDNSLRERVQEALDTAKTKLGSPGASDRAADIAIEMMAS